MATGARPDGANASVTRLGARRGLVHRADRRGRRGPREGTFPDDAIRSLDAIHWRRPWLWRRCVGDLDVLSLDERIRSNAIALGFRVLPD